MSQENFYRVAVFDSLGNEISEQELDKILNQYPPKDNPIFKIVPKSNTEISGTILKDTKNLDSLDGKLKFEDYRRLLYNDRASCICKIFSRSMLLKIKDYETSPSMKKKIEARLNSQYVKLID